MSTAQTALDWMQTLQLASPDRWLFRGQRNVYPKVQPSLARLEPNDRVVMWNACRRIHSAAAGVTGYAVESKYDRLALLQHYIGISPLIDLTGTPLIALYFALTGSIPNAECIVYALDTNVHKGGDAQIHIANHSFLVHPFNHGGLQHRWLRQDGYAACSTDWPAMDGVEKFNLLEVAGLQSFTFRPQVKDLTLIAALGDLESLADDPLVYQVRGALETVIRDLPISPSLQDRLNISKSISPAQQLRGELQQARAQSITLGAQDIQSKIENLIQSENAGLWDTSFDCGLRYFQHQLTILQSRCPLPASFTPDAPAGSQLAPQAEPSVGK